MADKGSNKRRILVLDTNVLMHDPAALFHFQEHDIYIPMIVLEELDAAKQGLSEVARNARQTSRFFDDLLTRANSSAIQSGLSLAGLLQNKSDTTGSLFFQTEAGQSAQPPLLSGTIPDNSILAYTLFLIGHYKERRVSLITKDINLRIKATLLGVEAEDYFNDRVLDDINLLFPGALMLPPSFWLPEKKLESWHDQHRTLYKIKEIDCSDWYPNQFIYPEEGGAGFEGIVRKVKPEEVTVELVQNYGSKGNRAWGINARNREQNFALNLLMDPEIDFVTLLGVAGTGKTLLTLAAALTLTLEEKYYKEIIMTRSTIPVGEDIGFLPGTEEEKMTPWMGALMDNLEVLAQPGEGGEWGRLATNDLLQNRIKIRSLNFMRGRTLINKFLIIDEAQNLTAKQMKTLITRAGPGTKVVCLGNNSQIDTPYLTETNSGLTYVVDRFKNWDHAGHITLCRGERSRLADYASENL